MNLHIEAPQSRIAERVLLPGDPLRDKYIAETFLDGAVCCSSVPNIFGPSVNCAPRADFSLLNGAVAQAGLRQIPVCAGNVTSADWFCDEENDNEKLADYGVMAADMETAGLYILAAKYGVRALEIFPVSDYLAAKEACTEEERQTSFNDMIRIALETIVSC